MDFMVSRYGDFVLYRLPLRGTTLLLWFGPALFFAVGLVSLIGYLRRRNAGDQDCAAERRRAGRPPARLLSAQSRTGSRLNAP